MSAHQEDREQSSIDLTMMFAVHNAFRRDLGLLIAAAGEDNASFEAGWQRFKSYLVIHHSAEDSALWPVMNGKLTGRTEELALMEAMQAEHDVLDPLIEKVDALLAERAYGELKPRIQELAELLTHHLEHEEQATLPVAQEVLTVEEWASFADAQRAGLGPEGVGPFFPWLLDGADQETERHVIGLMPPPMRGLFQDVWRPEYLKNAPLRPTA